MQNGEGSRQTLGLSTLGEGRIPERRQKARGPGQRRDQREAEEGACVSRGDWFYPLGTPQGRCGVRIRASFFLWALNVVKPGEMGAELIWAPPTTFVSGALENELLLRANQGAACK